MYFIDEIVHLMGFRMHFLLYLARQKSTLYMDNYLITLGMYLILMLFIKIYFAVAAKE